MKHAPALGQLRTLSIQQAAQALARGDVTSVELVAASFDRIAAFDRSGPRLNAVPVLNPSALREAQDSDARRARGESRGPLDGIPYTAKASFAVQGLPMTAGSPAFADLLARDDAFSIARLREAGAVCIGLTNMPPLAAGGMQRGLYGRAESPYNADYLTSAWASGSSNGSGTAVAAGFGVFGLGEETWSSGRAPASCNALVAYTPSRGMISIRGNWPLVPTMDVVVPHTRSVAELLEVLDVLVTDDDTPRGDFWRTQPWVELPPASERRPRSFTDLPTHASLIKLRLGAPRMYLGQDPGADPVITHPDVLGLFRTIRSRIEDAGASVEETGFPVLRTYEGGAKDGFALASAGFVPDGYLHAELWDASLRAIDDHIAAIGDPDLASIADADGDRIFPTPPDQLPDRYPDTDPHLADYPKLAHLAAPYDQIADFGEGVVGLERARVHLFEEWLDRRGLDALIFPSLADIAPANADVDQAASDLAWRNGTWVANGNVMLRHLGIPSVTIPMGVMPSTGMPVGLTIIGRSDDDARLLQMAAAIERLTGPRVLPSLTPELESGTWTGNTDRGPTPDAPPHVDVVASSSRTRDGVRIDVAGHVTPGCEVRVRIAGADVPVRIMRGAFFAERTMPADEHEHEHSVWRQPYGTLVTALSRDDRGPVAGALAVAGGIA